MVNFSLFNQTLGQGAAAPYVKGTPVTGAQTIYSLKIGTHFNAAKAAHFEWTGTPTGTLTRWESDKAEPDETNDNDWVQDSTFTSTNPAGAPNKFRNETVQRSPKWTRYKYQNTAGTGVMFGYLTIPGLA